MNKRFLKTHGFTIFEMLIVMVIISLLASFGANTFVEVYRNYQAQRDYSIGQTQINISVDRFFDTHLTPLFQTLAKPLAIDISQQWIIFAVYETGFGQSYNPDNTYLSQIVKLEMTTSSGISSINKYTYIPANEINDTLYADSIDFEALTDSLTATTAEVLISNIDVVSFSYLDIEQVETTTTEDIANIKTDITLTRSNIQRTLNQIVSPRRLLWEN